MKKARTIRKKAVGRRSDPLTGFHADAVTRVAIVKWAESRPDKPTLSEAIRQLVELGLSTKAGSKRISRARSNKSNAMAADQLDRLADPSASVEEQASRKRRLLTGPKEFRGIRIDRPKKR